MTTTLYSFLSFFGLSGPQLVDPQDLTELATFTVGSNKVSAALPGGAQAGAPVLKLGINDIEVCASTNDSVQMPFAIPGARVTVYNGGAQTLRIYANASPNTYNGSVVDQLVANATNSLTANGTALTLAAGYAADFVCGDNGYWKRLYAAS